MIYQSIKKPDPPLSEYADKHPEASAPLNNWYNIAKAADWNKLADIKRVFNNVDYVGNDRYVFNIKGTILYLII